jgi:alpha-tubulin suppressor-like RCC1 family protein
MPIDHDNLLACGNNQHGQLGLPHIKATCTFQPVAWRERNCASAVAAGMRHSGESVLTRAHHDDELSQTSLRSLG